MTAAGRGTGEGAAIVLGADVDGLAAAVTLAAAGRRVAVLDPRPVAGGLAARAEFHPGHVVPGLLHDTHLVRRELLAPLELERHGLAWRAADPGLFVACADGGSGFAFRRDREETTRDDTAHLHWRRLVDVAAPVVGDLLDRPPPEALEPKVGDLAALARQALRLRALGERDMLDLLRLVPTTAADWMADSFTAEETPLALALVAPALVGTVLGPLAPGTGGLVLLRECAAGPEPEGGLAALIDALLLRAREAGVEVRLDTSVSGVRIAEEGVLGVELEGGASLDAELVLSALDPRTTLIDLVAPGRLPPEVEAAAMAWRARGGTAALRLALSAPPRFTGADTTPERVVGARSLLHLERVADGLKYGRPPGDPWLDVRVFTGEGSAPAGGATLSILLCGVPENVDGGWSEGAREALVAASLDALEALAPGTRAALRAHELLTPPDIEARYHTAGGHLFGGELALDQLWLQRPALALARYATPVPGLYLCGTGSHPGGPFVGGAGVLAARTALSA